MMWLQKESLGWILMCIGSDSGKCCQTDRTALCSAGG